MPLGRAAFSGSLYEKLVPFVKDADGAGENFRRSLLLAGVMRWFANFRKHEDKADEWAAAGLIRRFGKAADASSLKAAGIREPIIRAIKSSSVADADAQSPLTADEEMGCLLVTLDNLTALIGEIALTRPKKSVNGLKVSAVQKKFKDRAFVPECSRLAVIQGARRLRWEIGDLTSKTIKAIGSCESEARAAATA